MDDRFVTIRAASGGETRARGSRFAGLALPVTTPEAADGAVEAAKRRFHDATHTCYAYRLAAGERVRLHDGGEPAGTAGRPILSAIERADLHNVLVIVTRWFGGVKLGKGGLARAYGEAAARALSGAEREVRYHMEELRLAFPHARTGDVMHAVSRAGAQIRETIYDEEVHLVLDVPRSRLEGLAAELTERTAGNLRMSRGGIRSGEDGG